ncbi:MAG: hypothetical protein K6E13_10550 [Lachnospiraceae bacterium]|nr:hypothetical protein [Lachnospiraceae bacterium]
MGDDMRGISINDPNCIQTVEELEAFIEEVGFVPLFANEIEGFSVEEHTAPDYWWTDVYEKDPWRWREIVAREKRIAYGKFFDKKAGFISLKWLPYFVNARRNGYDFDARWEDGFANRREKVIMDVYISSDEDGDSEFPERDILSTELKKQCGFKKGGYKNYPGIVTALQMQTYLVISDFVRRKNKSGVDYGMPVSVLNTPEAVWGYKEVTKMYGDSPEQSRQKIIDHVRELYIDADDKTIEKLIGKQTE